MQQQQQVLRDRLARVLGAGKLRLCRLLAAAIFDGAHARGEARGRFARLGLLAGFQLWHGRSRLVHELIGSAKLNGQGLQHDDGIVLPVALQLLGAQLPDELVDLRLRHLQPPELTLRSSGVIATKEAGRGALRVQAQRG